MTGPAAIRPIAGALAALMLLSACGGGAGGNALLGSPVYAPPPPPPASPTDRLVSAIEEQGCVLTADNVGAILMRASITRDQLLAITPDLAAAGRAEVAASGTIRILSDNCI